MFKSFTETEKRSDNRDTLNQPFEDCGTLVQQIVSIQATLRPHGLAVAFGPKELKYDDLEKLSNQLASYLCSIGIRLEEPVGVCLGRSPEFLIAVLAILKAGGVYLPLDPKYPTARLRYMLEDAQVRILVTGPTEAERFPGIGKLVAIDVKNWHFRQQATHVPRESPSSENIAYAIYTSGSTGKPKGVLISHGSLLNLVHWHRRRFALTPEDRVAQVASISFDAAVWEIWPCLSAGASLHLPDEDIRTSAVAFRDWILETGITVSFAPTPLALQLIKLPWPKQCSLRFLLTGGDVLTGTPPPGLPFVLVNNYGPTECTVVATSGVVLPNAVGEPDIGEPIDKVNVYILDENLREVSANVEGELYVGGVGLARGFINRPELDAERFIADPFSPGQRLFKTGDRGFHLPNGHIAFVGRTDDQVKIRGYRVELGEIGATLGRHPSVESCVVIARTATDRQKELVAYVVPYAGAYLGHRDLYEFLCEALPDYMIPSKFVRIEELPRTLSGKVDRLALPVPCTDNLIGDHSRTAPRNATEQRIVQVLCNLLGVTSIDIDDNFFLLGGHSLLGVQLIERIRATFGVQLSLHKVFESPTAAALAQEVQHLSEAQARSTQPGPHVS